MKSKRVRLWFGCLLTVLVPASALAGIVNPSFTPDFTGWSGAKFDGFAFTETPLDAAGLDADPLFQTIGGGLAQIEDAYDNPPGTNFFEVRVFQTFDLAVTDATLSFDFAWEITCEDPLAPCASAVDSFGANDIIQVTLQGGAAVADLLAGVDVNQLINSGTQSVDVSAFAGQTVTIEFFLQDGDFFEDDVFRFGNIVVAAAQVPAAPVPEPAPLALMGLGVVIAVVRLRRRLR